MPRRTLALVVTLFAIGTPAVAQADLPTDRPLQTVRVAESLRIAGEFWKQQPQCQVHVFAATEKELNPEGPSSGETVIEHTRPSECTIWISDVFAENNFGWRIKVCSTLVHAIGHILGFRHDFAHLSIMNPVNIPPVYGCNHRFLPRGQGWWWRTWYDPVKFAQRPAPDPPATPVTP